MAIPKKGSRKITVDDVNYRWLIRRKNTGEQVGGDGAGRLHVAVEQVLGSQLNTGTVLRIRTDRRHPHGYNLDPQSNITITPAVISNWIRQSILLGWQSNQGGQFSVRIDDNGEMSKADFR